MTRSAREKPWQAAVRRLGVLGLTGLWLVAAGCGPGPPGGEQPDRGGKGGRMRLRIEISSAPTEKPLQRLYTVEVTERDSKQPVAGAALRLTADMPSMPGVHHMRPVEAKPGPRPGTYSASLVFDMAGEWTVFVDVVRPVRDRAVYPDTVGAGVRDRQALSEICPGCLAAPEWPRVKERLAGSALKACPQGMGEGRKRCLARHLEQVRRDEGLRVALLTVAALAAEDPSILPYGHALAHDLARQSYASVGPRDTLAQCIEVLWGGCYHGTLEKHIERRGPIPKGLAEICGDLGSGLFQGAGHRCVEGLGRGLVISFGWQPSGALPVCDQLPAPGARAVCQEGVFREWAEVMLRKRGAVDAQSCRESPSRYAEPCFRALMPLAVERTPSPGGAARERCGDLPESHRRGCYRAVGGMIALEFKADVARSFESCRGQGDQRSCLAGVVREVLMGTPEQSKAVCRTLPAGEKAACYQAVGETLRLRHSSRDELVVACREAEQGFQETCLKGAGLSRLD